MKMKTIQVVLVGVLLSITKISAEDSCYEQRCYPAEISCHQQIPGASNLSCTVYGRSKPERSCPKIRSVLLKEKQGVHSEGMPVVEPSMFVLSSFCNSNYAFPALNISVKLKENNPYTGMVLQLNQETSSNYTLCRVIDFHSVEFKELVTLSYDCAFFHSDDIDTRYKLKVTALPNNRTEEYSFKIPSKSGVDPGTIEDWESAIFLQMHEITNLKKITAFFQHAPSKFNIEKYNVSLVINSTEVVQELKTVSVNNQSVISKVVFDNIIPGNTYVVAVQPFANSCKNCTKRKCCTTLSHEFSLLKSDEGAYLSYILGGAAFLILIVIIVLLIHSRSPKKPDGAIKVVLLYSWDCAKHFDVVRAFAEHLTKNCYCDVTIDYNNLLGVNSITWLAKSIDRNKKRIVLWSKGAMAKVDNCKLSEEPGHLASKYFCYAVKQLNDHLAKEVSLSFKNNSVCNVFFNYFPKKKVTETLNLLPKFQVKNDLNKLLCFIHDKTRQFHYDILLPEMPGSKLQEFPEGKKLLQAIEEMQKFDQEDENWLKISLPKQNNNNDNDSYSENDPLNKPSTSTTDEDLSTASIGSQDSDLGRGLSYDPMNRASTSEEDLSTISIASQDSDLEEGFSYDPDSGFESKPFTSATFEATEEYNPEIPETYQPTSEEYNPQISDNYPSSRADLNTGNYANPSEMKMNFPSLPCAPQMIMLPPGCYPPGMPVMPVAGFPPQPLNANMIPAMTFAPVSNPPGMECPQSFQLPTPNSHPNVGMGIPAGFPPPMAMAPMAFPYGLPNMPFQQHPQTFNDNSQFQQFQQFPFCFGQMPPMPQETVPGNSEHGRANSDADNEK